MKIFTALLQTLVWEKEWSHNKLVCTLTAFSHKSGSSSGLMEAFSSLNLLYLSILAHFPLLTSTPSFIAQQADWRRTVAWSITEAGVSFWKPINTSLCLNLQVLKIIILLDGQSVKMRWCLLCIGKKLYPLFKSIQNISLPFL